VIEVSSDFDKRVRACCHGEPIPKPMKLNPKNAVLRLQHNRLTKLIARFTDELTSWRKVEAEQAAAEEGAGAGEGGGEGLGGAKQTDVAKLLSAEESAFLDGRIAADDLRKQMAGTLNKATLKTDKLYKQVSVKRRRRAVATRGCSAA
jgi:hypothetical protein